MRTDEENEGERKRFCQLVSVQMHDASSTQKWHNVHFLGALRQKKNAKANMNVRETEKNQCNAVESSNFSSVLLWAGVDVCLCTWKQSFLCLNEKLGVH